MLDKEKEVKQLKAEIKRLRQEIDAYKTDDSRQSKFYKGLLEAIEDPVTVLDQDLKFVYSNQKAADLLAMDNDEIIGNSIPQLFPSSESASMVENLKKVIQTGQPLKQERLFHFSNQSIWLDSILIPL